MQNQRKMQRDMENWKQEVKQEWGQEERENTHISENQHGEE